MLGAQEEAFIAPITAAEQLAEPLAVPAAIDWRNKDGANWITPIRNQSSCGSCVAFGAVASLEALTRIEKGNPNLAIDPSEMHLFMCGGGSCSMGWYLSAARQYLSDNGTPDEACWPYEPRDRACSNTCSDWQNRALRIANYGYISGIEQYKTYTAIAPIFVRMQVYTDFYYYSGGIYEYSWGDLEGGHAACIIGYDTTSSPPYWIVKNSWGAGWGGKGLFPHKNGAVLD